MHTLYQALACDRESTHHAQWKHTMASVMCTGVVQTFGLLMLLCAGLPKHLSSFACFFLRQPHDGP